MQIPLGVYLKNENVLDEMVSIMEDLHTYVPTIHKRVEITTPGETEPDTIDDFKFHPVLFGGDQLTAARIRGCQRIRQNSVDKKGQLQGLVPCIEDWHAKVCLLEVFM